jgi:hypothetical protein
MEEIEKIKKSFVLIFQKIPLEQFAFETLREKPYKILRHRRSALISQSVFTLQSIYDLVLYLLTMRVPVEKNLMLY